MSEPFDQETATATSDLPPIKPMKGPPLGIIPALNEVFYGKPAPKEEIELPEPEPSTLDQCIEYAYIVAVVCFTILIAAGTVTAIVAMVSAVS